MKTSNLKLFFVLSLLTACNSPHISTTDASSLSAGTKGAITMTLNPSDGYKFYEYKRITLARVNSDRTVKVLTPAGAPDESSYGYLAFHDDRMFASTREGHAPITSTAYLLPGDYAPVALYLQGEGSRMFTAAIINVQRSARPQANSNDKLMAALLASDPNIADTGAQLKLENLHNKKIGDSVPVYRVEAGKTLNVGNITLVDSSITVGNMICNETREDYEQLLRVEAEHNKNALGTLTGLNPYKANPQLIEKAKNCPPQSEFDKIGNFQIKPL